MKKIILVLVIFFIFSQNLYSQTSEYKYDGQLKKGISHGQGTFTYKNGATCTGIWNGDFTGKNIVCTSATGRKYYEGELKNRKRDGYGTAYFENGDKYIGQYKDDKREGQGTYYHVNGNKYVGEFKDGQRNGKGTIFYADGRKIIDTWIDGKPINHEQKQEDKKYIYDLFSKAFKESEEAREYCKKIHTANLTIKSLTKLETCYSEEKLKIYSKYNLSYDKTVKILEREYLDLHENARSFVECVFLGSSSSTAAKEKAYNDNIYTIRSRAQEQINQEAEKFALEFIKTKRAQDKSPGADESKASKKGASGSAFFVNNKGNIVTNNHVIERCSGPVKVLYNKKEYTAKVIAKDSTLDLAVLNSDVKPNQYLKLSKKSGDKLDRVVAAGYPLGYKISDELKLTAGIVSATKGWKDNINEFQIDAALNPGNSGGPVVNDAGNLFGVAVAGLADRQNLNFAIKSKAVKDFLDVNKVIYSTATVEFDMDNKKRLKLLEDSTVFIYCN
jgi:S1-C subfamily serine protease